MLEGRIARLRFKEERKQMNNESCFWDVTNNICKFCTCPSSYYPDYCGECEKHLNVPVLVDQTCIVMQMTQWEALGLSPTFRVRSDRGAGEYGTVEEKLSKKLGLGRTFLRAGLLVSVSRIELEWSEEKVSVRII